MDLTGPIGDIFGGSVSTIVRIFSIIGILVSGAYIGGIAVFGSKEPTAGRYTKHITIAMGVIAFFIFLLIVV